MDDYNKSIGGVRKMLKDLKSEKYALVNPALAAMDEYVKGLYLKVLCTIAQYGNEPTEMQILFLKRIINGIGVEGSVEEYMRKALEISESDIQEFLSLIGKMNNKYYFALEGIIIASVGKENGSGYEYLAEIIELLGINKDDLRYLCLVVKSVLMQESSYYDEAKELINERVEILDFTPYIQNYYAGAIAESSSIVYYSTPDRKFPDSVKDKCIHTEKEVIFENSDINIDKAWRFEGCEEVIFKNCNVSGASDSIHFVFCKKISMIGTRFVDFKVPVFNEQEIEEFVIEKCEFENCFMVHKSNGAGSDYGGVIYTENASRTAKNMISKTAFKNCGGKNTRDYCSVAVISNCICNVTECYFYNCWNYRNLTEIDESSDNKALFLGRTKGSDNEIVFSAKFC